MRTLHWLERHLPKPVWDNLATLSILGLIAVLSWFGWKVVDLASANQSRIDDIQHSRIVSCESTYRAFLDVFRPFFPPDEKTWSPKQRHDWTKLKGIVNSKVSQCGRQTRP